MYVALLRAINVGGKNKVSMKALVEEFQAAGCERVETYIQSGNVVFAAAPAIASGISDAMEKRIRARFGLDVPVVIRSEGAWEKVIAENPYAKRKDFGDRTHVMFCADKLKAANVAKLDPKRSPEDEVTCRGQEIYLWMPNGMGRTKLTNAYFDRVLETVSTARNWRTVLKLAEMMKG